MVWEYEDTPRCNSGPYPWGVGVVSVSDTRRTPTRRRLERVGNSIMDVEEHESITENLESKVDEKDNKSVEIKVLFFARARDLTGMTDMLLMVSTGSTARDCLNNLLVKFSGLSEIRGCMVVDLNEEYTPENTVVKDRDELAIIPPISGG
ncbi:Molybdopterin synthase sulfur carrier subunit [Abeliophyllum distichum]|uniref:Molybdopterin synthase sulfur carrier subunit n=1 Tax=Abeliophyllum distichum TaxID=126358 RepID=A0ABD1SF65_9LAMI